MIVNKNAWQDFRIALHTHEVTCLGMTVEERLTDRGGATLFVTRNAVYKAASSLDEEPTTEVFGE